jgi:hypothetical protein
MISHLCGLTLPSHSLPPSVWATPFVIVNASGAPLVTLQPRVLSEPYFAHSLDTPT